MMEIAIETIVRKAMSILVLIQNLFEIFELELMAGDRIHNDLWEITIVSIMMITLMIRWIITGQIRVLGLDEMEEGRALGETIDPSPLEAYCSTLDTEN